MGEGRQQFQKEHKDHVACGKFPDEREYADFRHMIIKRPGASFPTLLVFQLYTLVIQIRFFS